MSDSLPPHGLDSWPPCPSLSAGARSNSCPLSRWCHPTVSSSAAPFSSCAQSFPALGPFSMNWLFAPDGQSTGTSASAQLIFHKNFTSKQNADVSKGRDAEMSHIHWLRFIMIKTPWCYAKKKKLLQIACKWTWNISSCLKRTKGKQSRLASKTWKEVVIKARRIRKCLGSSSPSRSKAYAWVITVNWSDFILKLPRAYKAAIKLSLH